MDLSEQVEKLAAPFIEGKHTVGLAVGVVCGADTQIYCYGSLEKDGSAAPDERTLFEIGSITKVFTTTLLADMHLKGEVDLDDPASKFLPSTLVLRSRKGVDVTLRHLATHTSGLPRVPRNMGLKNLRSGNPYAKYTVEDMYEFLSKSRFVTAPGAMYSYSNLGMGLLGHILSLVAEMDYEQLVVERICRPLGMNDTAITLSDDQLDRLAPGHARGKQVSNWDIPTLAGCGAFRSTVDDMLTFLKANIQPRATPVKDAIELGHTLQPRKKRNVWLGWLLVCLLLIGTVSAWIFVGQGIFAKSMIFMALLFLSAYLSPMVIPMPDMGLGWHVNSLDSEDLIVLLKVSSWKNAFKKKGCRLNPSPPSMAASSGTTGGRAAIEVTRALWKGEI